jgi:superfamily I DNA and/or RNA helicase/very-short-patch-repair endonuclease
MAIEDKASRLFDYISQVYSIDLPVIRDVYDYKNEVWWQADLVQSSQCNIKQFDSYSEGEEESGAESGTPWLTVTKRQYDAPPDVPSILTNWVTLSLNPTRKPTSKQTLPKIINFPDDVNRVAAFQQYMSTWKKWKEAEQETLPSIPSILNGWIDQKHPIAERPVLLETRKIEEHYEDNKARILAFNSYIHEQWTPWSNRVMPLFKANEFYDSLFALHQKLSVESDKYEIVWGHVFLAWQYNSEIKINHPLMLTPMTLSFDPQKRQVHLIPSQTAATRIEKDCLFNLEYPNQDNFIQYVQKLNDDGNSDETELDVWSNSQMKAIASSLTGYISKETLETSNLYSEDIVSRPAINPTPVIHNAPVIFVRERMRRLWVDDAKKISDAIYDGVDIPPFLQALIAVPNTPEMPSLEESSYNESVADEDDGELLLPLEYNDQQKEIVKKLNSHFGALVQGPPGTGKSHTIANIVSSLLARGKRVLVTSQTENALKVLRGYIPGKIRSLCVSHLGNDLEAKRQLAEAVDNIGKKLAEKNSQEAENRIQNLLKDIRISKEEQSRIKSHIKAWVELDSCSIELNNESITAHQAAKECSEKEQLHSWFPDKITYSTSFPLTDNELQSLSELLKEISPQDRKSCLKYLPNPENLQTPDSIGRKYSELKTYSLKTAEFDTHKDYWEDKLLEAPKETIDATITLLEKALKELQGIEEGWQLKILEYIHVEQNQYSFWIDIHNKCSTYRQIAWDAFSGIQGYEISYPQGLPDRLDVEVALEELIKVKPTNIINRARLSQNAKEVYKDVRIDGKELSTNERIEAVKKHFKYTDILKKISTIWKQSIGTVAGPELILELGMPIAEIDSKVTSLYKPIDWKNKYAEEIKNSLNALGCRKDNLYDKEALASILEALYCHSAFLNKTQIIAALTVYYKSLIKEAVNKNAHSLCEELAIAVKTRNFDEYSRIFNEVGRLHKLTPQVQELESFAKKIKGVAPRWYQTLEERAVENGVGAIEPDLKPAWRWRQIDEWLIELHNRESVDSLQNRLEKEKRKERELIVQLVTERTWQRQIANVKDHHYRALVAWAQAMKHYGKGTGKHAYRHLAAAGRAMVDAVGAVPAWIMPLHRVIESFQPKPCIFDVIIVDEASQCDIRALSVLFRGKKILVVGDPEQISPSNVGIDMDKVFAMINHLLADVPFKETFNINNSLYHIAEAIPRMDRTLLTEHFRCVPQIIEFNNRLCPTYNGKLEPLRQPNPMERLDPAIVAVPVENGYRNENDVNKPEAEALVEMIVKCCKDERYAFGGKNDRKRTMGVVSLQGEKQAKYIYDLIAQHIDETEREERKIICGDAYAFQGDERDVMFLSLVIATNSAFASLTKDSDRQRFNVATSRARDQVFLFHSVALSDMRNNQCVRYQLLDWYLKPLTAEVEASLEILKKKADSPFEIEVGERIIQRGYKVIPQYQPFLNDSGYRIDLVIQGKNNRIAVECDGDRWHGPDRWEADQRREAQLRRAGWRFWRISGSSFYRNKNTSLDGLWQFLNDEGITPHNEEEKKATVAQPATEVKDEKKAEEPKHPPVDEPMAENPVTQQEATTSSLTIPPLSYKPEVWFRIAQWCEETKSINSYWWDFAKEIRNMLKIGNKRFSVKQRTDMQTLWKMVFKKGFRI